MSWACITEPVVLDGFEFGAWISCPDPLFVFMQLQDNSQHVRLRIKMHDDDNLHASCELPVNEHFLQEIYGVVCRRAFLDEDLSLPLRSLMTLLLRYLEDAYRTTADAAGKNKLTDLYNVVERAYLLS